MIAIVRRFGLLFLFAMPAWSPVAAAANAPDNNWRVASIQGVVEVKAGDRASGWQVPNVGDTVTGPFFLRTGDDSRVVLHHRNDEVSVASNSVVRFEAEAVTAKGILTRVFQSIGYSLFKIEKNSGRQNVVETPYLVSVVKGTTFTVQSNTDYARVNLVEGRLLVQDADRTMARYLDGGQIASMARGDRGISVIDASGKPVPAPATAGGPASDREAAEIAVTGRGDVGNSSVIYTNNSIHNPNRAPGNSINNPHSKNYQRATQAVNDSVGAVGNMGRGQNRNNGKGRDQAPGLNK